ncbi:unnamed protein product [Didymodactylos carnosus]|uniref:Lectin n=1 Tax=Didymodactylos carnosus TaxID=1234261 RepID=A0A815IC74_9BILA|nr:unnamed protein product [Didymodactylos carnosus]CAF4243795.1 unnamed protein product [Didymodactylos carnosus]
MSAWVHHSFEQMQDIYRVILKYVEETKRFDLTTTAVTPVTTTATISATTVGVTVAGDGVLGANSGRLNMRWDVAIDSQLNVYVTDAFDNRTQFWTPGSSNGQFLMVSNGTITALYLDDSGKLLYYCDEDDGNVGKLSLSNQTITTIAGGNGPASDYNQISAFNHHIMLWPPHSTTGNLIAGTGVQGHGNDQLYHPLGIFVDRAGNSWIADT